MTHRIYDLDTQHAEWRRRRLERGVEPAISVEALKSAEALAQVVHYDLLIVDGRGSDGMPKFDERPSFVVQPTRSPFDDLSPAVFHQLIKTALPKARLVFTLDHVLTDAEEQTARKFLREAGYEVLSG